jgi:hypothetical protein
VAHRNGGEGLGGRLTATGLDARSDVPRLAHFPALTVGGLYAPEERLYFFRIRS